MKKRQFDFKEFLAEQMLEAEARNYWGASLKWFSNMVYDGYCTKEQIEEWSNTINNDYIFSADPRDSYLLLPYREQIVVLYIWSYLLLAEGNASRATYSTQELWDLIIKNDDIELSRRDRAMMTERLRVQDVRGALNEIMKYLHTPDLTIRMLEQSNVIPIEEDFTHISVKDNIICYFKDGAPVIVKHFEHRGCLYMGENWFEREPYYAAMPEDNKPIGNDAVSPIYQVIKAQRMLKQALRFVEFESKPIRKIIVAPEYKEIFSDHKLFAADCVELGIELHQDLIAINEDISSPYGDLFYCFQWSKAISITESLYKSYRTIDSGLIRAIIDDLHGEFTPNDSYKEENPFTIEDMR